MPGELQIPAWTWWIVTYFFLGGIAGGAYFLSAVVELVGGPEDRPVARMGYYIAFPLAILCALLLIVDLGQPLRFWHMVVYSKTLLPWVNWVSPMSVGSYALLFFGIFSFLSFVDALVETGRLPWAPLRNKYSGAPRMVYAIIGALFGFFLTAYTGELLSTTQMPIWTNTPLLGALFAASGAATGAAAITLGLRSSRAREVAVTRGDVGASQVAVPVTSGAAGTSRVVTPAWQKLRQVDMVAIIVEALLLAAFVLLLGRTALPLFSGVTGILFIGGVLIAGLLVPFALQLWVGRAADRHASIVVIIAILTLLGGFLFRTAIVMGGQGLL